MLSSFEHYSRPSNFEDWESIVLLAPTTLRTVPGRECTKQWCRARSTDKFLMAEKSSLT